MRDAHRMKEKLDLSLDNRQIVSLLVAVIVVMGAVFVLGVVVGKKLSESGRTEHATDILAALDQKKEAMEKVEAAPSLSFHETLTGPTENQPEVRVVTLAPPKPEPKPEEAPKAVAEAEPKAEEKPMETAPAPEVKVELAQAPTAKTETITASAREPVGKVAVAAVPTRTATPKGSSPLSEAIARAQKPQPAVPSGSGNYTLQLSAAQDRSEAERFARNLENKGYPTYIVEAEVPGKGTWYRVRLGRFPTKEKAQKYLVDFRRETKQEAFVATAP